MTDCVQHRFSHPCPSHGSAAGRRVCRTCRGHASSGVISSTPPLACSADTQRTGGRRHSPKKLFHTATNKTCRPVDEPGGQGRGSLSLDIDGAACSPVPASPSALLFVRRKQGTVKSWPSGLLHTPPQQPILHSATKTLRGVEVVDSSSTCPVPAQKASPCFLTLETGGFRAVQNPFPLGFAHQASPRLGRYGLTTVSREPVPPHRKPQQ